MRRRIIDSIHRGKSRASPHSFWTLCAVELAKVFSEIIYDSDLLSKCYCSLRSRNFDEEFIVEITTGIPSALICSNDLNPDEFLSHNLPTADYNQPFLIINDVGTGKTTYLYHYFLIKIKELHLDSRIDGILINLREFGEGEGIPLDKLEEFTHAKIHEHLTSRYPDISSPDIELGKKIFEIELIPYKQLIKYKRSKNEADYENYIFHKIDGFMNDRKVFNRARLRYLSSKDKKNLHSDR